MFQQQLAEVLYFARAEAKRTERDLSAALHHVETAAPPTTAAGATEAVAKTISALHALKRRLSEAHDAEEGHLHACRRRLAQNTPPALDELLIDYLPRQGFIASAAALVAEEPADGIGGEVAVAAAAAACTPRSLEERRRLLAALAARDVQPVLEWCSLHHARLKKLSSPLESLLHLRVFARHAREGDVVAAVSYARQHLAPLCPEHTALVQAAMGALALGTPSPLPIPTPSPTPGTTPEGCCAPAAGVVPGAGGPPAADDGEPIPTGAASQGVVPGAIPTGAASPGVVPGVVPPPPHPLYDDVARWSEVIAAFDAAHRALTSAPSHPLLIQTLWAALACLRTPSCVVPSPLEPSPTAGETAAGASTAAAKAAAKAATVDPIVHRHSATADREALWGAPAPAAAEPFAMEPGEPGARDGARDDARDGARDARDDAREDARDGALADARGGARDGALEDARVTTAAAAAAAALPPVLSADPLTMLSERARSLTRVLLERTRASSAVSSADEAAEASGGPSMRRRDGTRLSDARHGGHLGGNLGGNLEGNLGGDLGGNLEGHLGGNLEGDLGGNLEERVQRHLASLAAAEVEAEATAAAASGVHDLAAAARVVEARVASGTASRQASMAGFVTAKQGSGGALPSTSASVAPAPAPLDAAAACSCPVCCEPYATLAAHVPNVERAYSSLVCRLSGECMDDNNPPFVLPSGRVYSRKVLTALAESDALVDPCTGERLVLGQLRRAYFL
jgi:hypothetical protein